MRFSALHIRKDKVVEGNTNDKSEPYFEYSLVIGFDKAEAKKIFAGQSFNVVLEIDHKTTEKDDLGSISVTYPKDKTSIPMIDDLSFAITKDHLFIQDRAYVTNIHIRVPVNKDDKPDGANGKLEDEKFILKVSSLDGKAVALMASEATIEDDDDVSDDKSYSFGENGDDHFDIIDVGPGFDISRGPDQTGLLLGNGNYRLAGELAFGSDEEGPEFEPIMRDVGPTGNDLLFPLIEQDSLF